MRIMYFNTDTYSLMAKTDEELQEYYERTYKENVEGGYIDPEETSLEDWINDDNACKYVPDGVLFDDRSGTHFVIEDYGPQGYWCRNVEVDDYGNITEKLSEGWRTEREAEAFF